MISFYWFLATILFCKHSWHHYTNCMDELQPRIHVDNSIFSVQRINMDCMCVCVRNLSSEQCTLCVHVLRFDKWRTQCNTLCKKWPFYYHWCSIYTRMFRAVSEAIEFPKRSPISFTCIEHTCRLLNFHEESKIFCLNSNAALSMSGISRMNRNHNGISMHECNVSAYMLYWWHWPPLNRFMSRRDSISQYKFFRYHQTPTEKPIRCIFDDFQSERCFWIIKVLRWFYLRSFSAKSKRRNRRNLSRKSEVNSNGFNSL